MIKCSNCGKDVHKKPSQIRKNKSGNMFCCMKCHNDFRRHEIVVECKHCNKLFITRYSEKRQLKYCSKKCSELAVIGTKRSEETCRKISESRIGEKNSQWKGDNVGYISLHEYVRNHKQEPDACVICGEDKPLDLANISQEYKRDLDDWEYLCRRCHMIKDGRLDRLKERMSNRHKFL